MRSKELLKVLCTIGLLAQFLQAQTGCVISPGSRVIVPDTQRRFGSLVSAEVIRQRVPVQITENQDTASYVLSAAGSKSDMSVKLLDLATKDVVWSIDPAGQSWLKLGRGQKGESKVAARIVRQLNLDCFGKTGSRVSTVNPYEGYPRCSFAPFC